MVRPQTLRVVLKQVLVVMIKVLLLETMLSHGNVVLQAPPPLGSVEVGMSAADMIPATQDQLEELPRGPGIDHAEAKTAIPIMVVKPAMALHQLLPGNKPLPILLPVLHLEHIQVTLLPDMVRATKETWAHLLGLLLRLG